ncbi:cytidine deaminase-like protein [Bombardia bombarda]|uniref:Cytidine deaminase-like protein n=1 Tax=Bombardia bombarda TaxID=252184 RepID=A0AA40CGU9_9PEZI|nr:cytidine deaminase-like protein [Bombardia bombarda]
MTRSIHLLVLLTCAVLSGKCQQYYHAHAHQLNKEPIAGPTLSINGVSSAVRTYWMRQATAALGAPCPFAAFGTVIVNHTANSGLGQIVCSGANANSKTGNPTMHGEMAAITNCSAILTDPTGPYKLTAAQAISAFKDLSLYTNAESCPMCASAIRWAGFREYIYGTTIRTLIEKGWGQIRISSLELIAQSFDLPNPTRVLGEILTNETDPYFAWQFDPKHECPKGCKRAASGSCGAGG